MIEAVEIGLEEKTLKAIRRVFSSHFSVHKAILYGSRAKGNYRPGSDIDLTLSGDGLLPDVLYKLDRELDDLLLPYTFDLSLLSEIDNQNLLEHIKRVGLVLYEKPGIEVSSAC